MIKSAKGGLTSLYFSLITHTLALNFTCTYYKESVTFLENYYYAF